MGFSTPATRHDDIPIIETSPRQLPRPSVEPAPIFTRPVRVPEFVPLKKQERR